MQRRQEAAVLVAGRLAVFGGGASSRPQLAAQLLSHAVAHGPAVEAATKEVCKSAFRQRHPRSTSASAFHMAASIGTAGLWVMPGCLSAASRAVYLTAHLRQGSVKTGSVECWQNLRGGWRGGHPQVPQEGRPADAVEGLCGRHRCSLGAPPGRRGRPGGLHCPDRPSGSQLRGLQQLAGCRGPHLHRLRRCSAG